MNGYQLTIIIGTAGADAEVKNLEGGSTVATMPVAVNESYTDKNTGERKTKTEWIRIEAWSGLANFLGQYGKKGTNFMIEGKIKTDSWTDDAGQTRYSTKVVANKVQFTQPMSANTNQGQPQQQAQPQQPAPQQAPMNQAPQQPAPQAQPQQQAPQAQPQQVAQEQTQQYVTNDQFLNVANNGDDLPF